MASINREKAGTVSKLLWTLLIIPALAYGAIAALVLASSFTSAPELAADLYPWLPTRGLVRLRYDTRAALANISCPVLVAHSPDDDIIPFHHGQRLYDAAAEPRAFLKMAGRHNEGFIFLLPAWVEALGGFLGRHVPP